MQQTHCPLCYTELEVRDVAPCHECGSVPEEIGHFEQRKHTYAEYMVLPPLSLVLCNVCDVDFGSFDPSFFGLPAHAKIGLQYMTFVRSVNDTNIGKDKVCPSCGYRLAFLNFVASARARNAR